MSDSSTSEDLGPSILDYCPTQSHPCPLEIDAVEVLNESVNKAHLVSTVKSRLRGMLAAEYMVRGFECVYWLVVAVMFHREKTKAVQGKLKKELSEVYVRLMLDNLESGDKTHMTYLPVILSHAITYDLYTHFPASRHLLSELFITHLTQQVYLSLWGISTSEFFAKQQLLTVYRSRAFRMNSQEE